MLRDIVPMRVNRHTFHVNNAIYEFYADDETVRLRIRLPFYRWRYAMDNQSSISFMTRAMEDVELVGEPDCDYPLDLSPQYLDILADRFWQDLTGGVHRLDLVTLVKNCKAGDPPR